MLSKKAKYGIKASLSLAGRDMGQPVLVADLATQSSIPKKFLEIILLDLRNGGILASRKGRGGGYYLAKPPESITVGQIIQILEGTLSPLPCIGQTSSPNPCGDCKDAISCGVRLVMKDVHDATVAILDKANLADLLERARKIKADSGMTWEI